MFYFSLSIKISTGKGTILFITEVRAVFVLALASQGSFLFSHRGCSQINRSAASSTCRHDTLSLSQAGRAHRCCHGDGLQRLRFLYNIRCASQTGEQHLTHAESAWRIRQYPLT